MKFQRILTPLLLLVASASALAQEVGVLHLNPLHLELPSTWTFNGSKQPLEGKGPDGEKVLISIMRIRPGAASGPVPTANESLQGLVQGPMVQLASKGGQVVVRPVSQFPTKEGKAAYSAGSESSGIFGGKSYFIQYVLAAPGTVIYLTFEGKGPAATAMQRFDAFFATQRWDE
jgi:hypothetical protein